MTRRSFVQAIAAVVAACVLPFRGRAEPPVTPEPRAPKSRVDGCELCGSPLIAGIWYEYADRTTFTTNGWQALMPVREHRRCRDHLFITSGSMMVKPYTAQAFVQFGI